MLIDHNNEETLPIVLDSACWAGHTIYPNTKMDEQRWRRSSRNTAAIASS